MSNLFQKLDFFKDETFLAELEGRILIFAASVVLLACATFAFGGTCSAWQWFVPLFVCSAWRGGLRRRTAMVFLSVLAAMWLLAPFFIDQNSGYDTLSYHMPMIRLLSSGWNPFSDPEAKGICAKLGLDVWGMRPYHVAYCSKPAAIFCAVAYFFIREPYAIIYPLPFILFIAVFVTSLRVFRKETIAVPLFLMVLHWHCLPFDFFVDSSLMLASTGLLLTMFADLRDDKISYVPLAGYGFWLVNLKLPGILAAGVFFIIFAIARLLRHRDRKSFLRLAVFAIILVVASGLASFNPYGTSFRDKGHPLYPFETVDAERFPVRNMVRDFKDMNDDAAQMGRVGMLIHSYISPRITSAYYNCKLKRTDFAPHKTPWDYRLHDDPEAVHFPLTWKQRVGVMLTVALMLTVPGLRLLGASLVLLIVAFPFDQIGYVRYQPWIHSCWCLSLSVLAPIVLCRITAVLRIFQLCILAIISVSALKVANVELSVLGRAEEEIRTMPHEVYSCVLLPQVIADRDARSTGYRLQDLKKAHSTNLILRNRQAGIDKCHDVVCVSNDEALEMHKTSLDYFVKDSPVDDVVFSKWKRLINRMSNVRLAYENYLDRVRNMLEYLDNGKYKE